MKLAVDTSDIHRALIYHTSQKFNYNHPKVMINGRSDNFKEKLLSFLLVIKIAFYLYTSW